MFTPITLHGPRTAGTVINEIPRPHQTGERMRIGRVLVAALLVTLFTTAATAATGPFGGLPYN
ncbi:hypothetical protein GCM10018963_35080 [Saccharothrix longispora]